MRLLLLYGAPAAGKYTVGKALAKKTGYPLLHIHAVYDMLEDIFDKENYEHTLPLMNALCLEIISHAAQQKIPGLIFTYAELARDNFSYAKKLQRTVRKYGGKIYFVHLSCTATELRRRVTNPSRKRFKKTKTAAELDYLLSIKEYDKEFPGAHSMGLDTSAVKPAAAAGIIFSRFFR